MNHRAGRQGLEWLLTQRGRARCHPMLSRVQMADEAATVVAMDARMNELAALAASGPGRVVFLTGAGISAESGIPTFRGPGGYWRVGSRNYKPHELATRAAFQRFPEEIWGWYLYRRTTCRVAEPTPAHRALARLEHALGDRFLLVTQNVDGLHLRAGNSEQRIYEIHGNIDAMRCADECSSWIAPVPRELDGWEREKPVGAAELERLKCAECGGLARPHILWFDESYDEEFYYWNSSLGAAAAASMFVVIGTSGATNLPMQMASIAAGRQIPFIALNVEETPFTAMAERLSNGAFLAGTAEVLAPRLVGAIATAYGVTLRDDLEPSEAMPQTA